MKSLANFVCVICVGACAATNSRDRSLIEHMGDTQFDYVPLSAESMTAEAEVIVRGHVTSVSDGRVVDFASGESNPLEMAVIEVTVTEALKGQVGPRVYFEYIRGGASAEEMGARLPTEEVMLFLIVPRWDVDTYRFSFPDRGLPAGETLYTLRSPQALLLEAEGSVLQPLEPETGSQLFDAASLDDAEAEVTALVLDAEQDAQP